MMMMKATRWTLAAALVALLAGSGLWLYRTQQPQRPDYLTTEPRGPYPWLDRLYSQNPREVEQATSEVTAMGADAVPAIKTTLRDPESEAGRLKAALKAAGLLGRTAAPAIPEIAAALHEPGLTAEAAIALSHMGPEALDPLREALASADPVVRREALRSIGKLQDRAPLDAAVVVPLLTGRMRDGDATVRAVAATYLGIVDERPGEAVPALAEGLSDPDPEVRRASAAALASYGEAAKPALTALRAAAADRQDDVAREAERTLVKLQQK